MTSFPLFLSVVLVTRNQASELGPMLEDVSRVVADIVTDYELIIIDNASEDDGVGVLQRLTREGGLPNIQVFALTKEVDVDTASWVGLENALGDFVAVLNPPADDAGFLPAMLERAAGGADVVFASNDNAHARDPVYRMCYGAFNATYKWFNGINLAKEAPQFRIISRRVLNFILQHPMPAITYRHLPATGGFSRVYLNYSGPAMRQRSKRLMDSIDRGMRLLVSTTRAPMRLVTMLSLFGATANLLYSLYVIAIAIWKTDVAPGWVTLSLQQSGMFFLISLVLLILGEYVLHMATLSNEGPLYHVAREFTSAVMTRRQKLNVEDQSLLGSDGRSASATPRVMTLR
jgi:polyisoprenyl-phosphate glycosyltransferase